MSTNSPSTVTACDRWIQALANCFAWVAEPQFDGIVELS